MEPPAPSAPPSLKILEVSQVSPPDGSVAETSLPLTFLDVPWLHLPPVEGLFFYHHPHPTSHFLIHLPALKASLSLCLQHFFPLCGSIRLTPGTSDQYEIHYVEGDAVAVTVAECAGDFNELWRDEAKEVSKLALVASVFPRPKPGTLSPALAVRITVFPHQGVVLGLLAHHLACDGRAISNFIHAWAAACRLGDDSFLRASLPVVDRGVIPDPHGLYSESVKHLLPGEFIRLPQGEEEHEKKVVMATFRLSQGQLQQLKAKVSEVAERRKIEVRCTTVVAAYGFVWVGQVRARGVAQLSDTADSVFAVDLRARMKPAVSDQYLGNCFRPCFVQAPVGDLVGDAGLLVACAAISKALAEADRVGVDDAHDWGVRYLAVLGNKPLTAAGSPRFHVYEVDFGWGKPLKVEAPSISHTGALALAESIREEGGVEIGLAWPRHEMDVFTSYFREGLQKQS